MSAKPVIVWMRRDLRLGDHPALVAAAASGKPVIPVYVHDAALGGAWRLGAASRWWLAQSLKALDRSLRERESRLVLRSGETVATLAGLARAIGAEAVYMTRGYEPFVRPLEDRLKQELQQAGIGCRRFAGHLLFEPEAIETKSGGSFKVFTPFYRACLAHEPPRTPCPAPASLPAPDAWPSSEDLTSWALEPRAPDWAGGMRAFWTPGEHGALQRLAGFIDQLLAGYDDTRNRPDMRGTSQLSPHLAFGELSPNQVWHAVAAAAAAQPKQSPGAESYLRELIWREFSYHLLFHHPDLPDAPFKPDFAAFPWTRNRSALKAWQQGRTGYPIVDAGMRELWALGWMHNRVRMITASFLIKHLGIDWREGERWFWDTLVDADLANNAASWQWVAGCGADAAPYFRIFNPVLQGEKFDPQGDYVRRWVPELAGLGPKHIHAPWLAPADALARAGVKLGTTYPEPIVDHATARKAALASYQKLTKGAA